AQKLLGNINWVCSYLGITTEPLSPLFRLLKGDTDLTSPKKLDKDANYTLETVEEAMSNRQVYRVDIELSINLYVPISDMRPTGILAQWSEKWKDSLHIL
ncbi:POK18 protein, partial [Pedionomus torquatus]|nr:POK18 protein [Pedionomus torquatus]